MSTLAGIKLSAANTAMRIAVTGARGWVGSAVVAYLRSNGAAVRQLVRRNPPSEEFHFDLADPTNAPRWPALLDGCDCIIHCAAHVHQPRENKTERARFHTINQTGTELLAQAAKAAGVRRFVYISTIAVYDWSAGVGEENGPLSAETAYARSKLGGEEAVKTHLSDWVILRLATVFGRDDRANVAALARATRRKRFVLPSGRDPSKSLIAIDDAASIIGQLALNPAVAKQTINVACPQPIRLSALAALFARAFDVPPPQSVPVQLLRVAAVIGDLLAYAQLAAPLTTRKLDSLCTSTVVSTSKLQEIIPDFPWQPLTDQISRYLLYYRQV